MMKKERNTTVITPRIVSSIVAPAMSDAGEV
jgi:hypothetical protein